MTAAIESLDRLIEQLSGNAAAPRAGRGDAIDEVAGSPPRRTDVPDLREHPAVRQFRQDLIDGFVRVDTARQLLDLVSVVVRAMALR